MPDFLIDDLLRYVGRTVTIFTTSGGLSGSGFTGVLASVCGNTVRLITDIAEAPACPIGSSCTGPSCPCGNYGYPSYGSGCGFGGCSNPLGSITEIPIARIAGFTHNAI